MDAMPNEHHGAHDDAAQMDSRGWKSAVVAVVDSDDRSCGCWRCRVSRLAG